MEVFVLIHIESSEIVGVFSSGDKAEKYKNNLTEKLSYKSWVYRIETFVIDKF